MGEDWSIWEQALPDDEFFRRPPAYIEGFGMAKEDLSTILDYLLDEQNAREFALLHDIGTWFAIALLSSNFGAPGALYLLQEKQALPLLVSMFLLGIKLGQDREALSRYHRLLGSLYDREE